MRQTDRSKLDQLKQAAAAGDWREALRVAQAFQHLGPQKEAITRAWAALENPNFYRQIGKDPATLVSLGITALRVRYSL